jgi:hypothetical protein
MSRAPSLAPFRIRQGSLWLEEVELAALATELAGRAALVLSHRALDATLRRALRDAGGPVTVDVSVLGPREALALAAAAGCWARVASPHELALARAAGFPPERLLVAAPVLDDGLVRDALAAGLGVLQARGEDAANVARIAGALGHAVPPATGAPPVWPAAGLRRAGGLLAPLLAGPPDLALDAAWEPWGRGHVVVAPLRGLTGEIVEASVRGLPGRSAAARLLGPVGRGDSVLVPDPRAAVPQRPDLAHSLPAVVLVRGGSWRLLDPRPLPAARAD